MRILVALTVMCLACSVSRLVARPGQMSQYDRESVERGKSAFIATCGSCHGSAARGGEGGPDLLRSLLVLDDEGGRQLVEFLRSGLPANRMPAFQLPAEQATDIATFLHSQITAAAYRRTYQILHILVGDAKAGEAYFNGEGKCGK